MIIEQINKQHILSLSLLTPPYAYPASISLGLGATDAILSHATIEQ